MYKVVFYEEKPGYSSLENYILDLSTKTTKDARIQFRKISQYIDLLATYGTRLSQDITKHIKDGIWELRPGFNRIFYFYYKNNTYVLLHMFRKKSTKTPKHEIERAIKERGNYLKIYGGLNI